MAHNKFKYAGHDSLADMVKGHIHEWRDALIHKKIDQFETSHLDHELAALDAIEEAVNIDLVEKCNKKT